MNNESNLKEGDELIVDHEIITISGNTIVSEGQRVKISKIFRREGFIGKGSGVWYPEKITGFTLEGHEGGVFPTTAFKETKHIEQ